MAMLRSLVEGRSCGMQLQTVSADRFLCPGSWRNLPKDCFSSHSFKDCSVPEDGRISDPDVPKSRLWPCTIQRPDRKNNWNLQTVPWKTRACSQMHPEQTAANTTIQGSQGKAAGVVLTFFRAAVSQLDGAAGPGGEECFAGTRAGRGRRAAQLN